MGCAKSRSAILHEKSAWTTSCLAPLLCYSSPSPPHLTPKPPNPARPPSPHPHHLMPMQPGIMPVPLHQRRVAAVLDDPPPLFGDGVDVAGGLGLAEERATNRRTIAPDNGETYFLPRRVQWCAVVQDLNGFCARVDIDLYTLVKFTVLNCCKVLSIRQASQPGNCSTSISGHPSVRGP